MADSEVHLLALHGNGGGASRYQLCLPHFASQGLKFVAHTLPGFEGRPLIDPVLGWPELIGDLRQALTQLPRPRWLLGHGIGASVVLQFLQDHADWVDGAVIHSPVGARLGQRRFPRLMRPTWMRALVKACLSQPWLMPIWSALLFRRPVPWRARRKFFSEYARCQAFGGFFDLLTADWFEGLRPIDLSAAVLLWGQQERILAAGHLEDFQRLMPQAQVHVEPDWDHFPMLESPEHYARVVSQLVLGPRIKWLPGPDRLPAKARYLSQALKAGLPVPSVALVESGTELETLPGRWAVRSAHPGEDGESSSQAGRYLSLLDVAGPDLPGAFDRVAQAQDQAPVLLMRMVQARWAGVAFLEEQFEEDVLNWTEGLADRLLQGHQPAQRRSLARLDFGVAAEPGWPGRVQRLLFQLRRSFPGSWDVEWADDGERTWLLQMRPVSAATRRQEWFTAANQREILPDPPSRFMVGILRLCQNRLFDYYRQFDSSLPAGRPFLDLFLDRPFINLSLLFGLMIRWGLPSRLVTDNIGGGSLPEVPLRPAQCLKKWRVHLRLAWHQTRVVGSTDRAIERLQTLGQMAAKGDAATCIQSLQSIYLTLVHQMMALTASMSIPLFLLRAWGTSPRFEVESTRMVHDLEPLRNLDPESPLFAERLRRYVDRHGHRGAFESDIARPRICDNPLAWVKPMLDYRPSPLAKLSWRERLAQPLMWWAAPAVKAREELRSQAMKAFLQARLRLLQLSSEQGLTPQQLWSLDPQELLSSAFLSRGFWEERQTELERLKSFHLPDLISSFDDLESYASGPARSGSRLSGLPLTRGKVRGRAWVCSEPTSSPTLAGPLILVAQAIDPGWLPCLTQVQGVAIEIGGDLSHGSILLREMGVPAVTNLRGLWGWVDEGEWLELNADRGSLSRCEPPA